MRVYVALCNLTARFTILVGSLELELAGLFVMLLRGDLVIEFVGHAEEDDEEGKPLVGVDAVLEDDDADEDGEDLASGRNKRVNVLLEVRDHVIDCHLPRDLHAANP